MDHTRPLLQVPITDHERRRQRQDRIIADFQQSSHPSRHALDSRFSESLGRFRSLRAPSRADDVYEAQNIGEHADHLPAYESESHYSSEGDDYPAHHDRMPTETPSSTYQEIHASDSSSPEHSSRAEHYWHPFWLRTRTLLSIAFLYAAFIAGFVMLCRQASSQDGLRVTSRQYYLWLCVPTIVLVVISSAWHQVDYHVRMLMPWKELREGPTNASSSLLVDYTSVVDAAALFKALKQLHIPVIATITGCYVTKILLLFSTALLFRRTLDITNQYTAIADPAFNVDAIKATVLDPHSTSLHSALYTYYQQRSNNPVVQTGLAGSYAYEPLRVMTAAVVNVPGEKMVYTAETDAFIPLITCRSAKLQPKGLELVSTSLSYNSTLRPYGRLPNITLALKEPEICADAEHISHPALDPVYHLVPPFQVQTSIRKLKCNDVATQHSSTGVVLAITNTSYTQVLLRNVSRPTGGPLPLALNTTRRIQNYTAVLCQPYYSIGRAVLTNDTSLYSTSGVSTSILTGVQNKTLPELSVDNMNDILIALLNRNSSMLPGSRPQANQSSIVRSNAFDLLQLFTNSASYDGFFNAEILSAAVMDMYLGILPPLVAQSSAANPSLAIDIHRVANITWQEERMCADWVVASILVSGLGLLILVLILLIFIGPHTVVPRNPSTIAAAGAILARSAGLNNFLQTEYFASAMSSRLTEDYRVSSAVAIGKDGSKGFRIHATPNSIEQRQQRRQARRTFTYWNPLSSKLRSLLATTSFLLLLIATLEVIQHFSDRRRGFLDMDESSVIIYPTRLVPAFALITVAGVIGYFAFHIILFAPWSTMYVGNVTARRSVLLHFLDSTAPLAALRAVKLRLWNVLAAILAIAVSALLVVISPNLYHVQRFTFPGPSRSLHAVDTFDLNSAPTATNDKGAAAALSLIMHNSTGFSPGTWDELAFVGLSLGPSEVAQQGHVIYTGGLTAKIPAYRADLMCQIQKSVNTTILGDHARVNINYRLPVDCSRKVNRTENSEVEFATEFVLSQKDHTHVGRQFDIGFDPGASSYGYLSEADVATTDDIPSECPSILFVWGSLLTNSKNSANISATVCYQQIYELNVNATLVRNTSMIDGRTPPQAIEASAVLLNNPNSTNNGTSFDFRIQANLAHQLGTYNDANEQQVNPGVNVDAFFQAVLIGTSPHLLSQELFNNQTATIARIRHVYRMYMAQVLDSNMRTPVSETTSAGDQSISVYDASTTILASRLVQSRASKISLQILISIIIPLLAFSWMSTRMRNILPCNPCTIAGTMSLLAGSELCRSSDDRLCPCCGKLRHGRPEYMDEFDYLHQRESDDQHSISDSSRAIIKPGTEWMDDVRFTRVFEDHLYSLGQWADARHGSSSTRYGVDVVSDRSTKVFSRTPKTSSWYLNRKRPDSGIDTSGESAILSGAIQVPPQGRPRALSRVDVNERGRYAHVRNESDGQRSFRNRPGFVGSGSPQPGTSF